MLKRLEKWKGKSKVLNAMSNKLQIVENDRLSRWVRLTKVSKTERKCDEML
jgi:hypothetical protein